MQRSAAGTALLLRLASAAGDNNDGMSAGHAVHVAPIAAVADNWKALERLERANLGGRPRPAGLIGVPQPPAVAC